MIAGNLRSFDDAVKGAHGPLFQIECLLAPPDIVLHPNGNEVFKQAVNSLKGCVESTRALPRWMRGTCLECVPQKVEGEDELFVYSYFADVAENSEIVETMQQVPRNIQNTLNTLLRFVHSFRSYKHLWRQPQDKMSAASKWFQKEQTLAGFDERFQFFVTQMDKIDSLLPPYRTQECIRLHLEPFHRSVREHARSWSECYGKLLHDSSRELLVNFKTDMLERQARLDEQPKNLEELKAILKAISDVAEISLDVEMKLRDIDERYAFPLLPFPFSLVLHFSSEDLT